MFSNRFANDILILTGSPNRELFYYILNPILQTTYLTLLNKMASKTYNSIFYKNELLNIFKHQKLTQTFLALFSSIYHPLSFYHFSHLTITPYPYLCTQ